MNKTKKIDPEEQFWTEVEENSKWRIYEILTQNLPLHNVELIEDNWNVGGTKKVEELRKKVGFFPEKDVDYRMILRDHVPNYYSDHEDRAKLANGNWDSEDVKYVAQEVALHYSLAVIKGFIRSLSAYDCYDPSFFSNLTTN